MKRLSSCRGDDMQRNLSVSMSLDSGSSCKDERSARGRGSQELPIAEEAGLSTLAVPAVSAFVLAPPYETGDTGNSRAAGFPDLTGIQASSVKLWIPAISAIYHSHSEYKSSQYSPTLGAVAVDEPS